LKLAIEVEATINLNAWRVVGANRASSKIDLPIKLRDKLAGVVHTNVRQKLLICYPFKSFLQ
jgi:hypothetical protein